MEWINPHSWLTLDVKNADGSIATWESRPGKLLFMGSSGTPGAGRNQTEVEIPPRREDPRAVRFLIQLIHLQI